MTKHDLRIMKYLPGLKAVWFFFKKEDGLKIALSEREIRKILSVLRESYDDQLDLRQNDED